MTKTEAKARTANPPRTSAPGRPAGRDSERVKADLMKAAQEHFLKRDFKAVSLRAIAQSAGVNGAMVSYYFGSKHGLYMAMVDKLLSNLSRSFDNVSHLSVAEFSASYSQLISENPWWPNFIVREVLFSEGETRQAVVARFGSLFAPKLLESITEEIELGNFRADLNPQLALMSLLGLTVFPFLARPMLEESLNMTLDEKTVGILAAHNTQLFLTGVESPDTKGSPS